MAEKNIILYARVQFMRTRNKNKYGRDIEDE